MSGKALGWVMDHSPYKGANYTVHLIIGDIANDQNAWEIWLSQGNLAKKARVSRQTVNDALERLTKDGFLTLIEDNSSQRKSNRYRFNMSTEPTCHVNQDDMHMSTEPTLTKEGTQGERKRTPPQDEPEGFSEFWSIYPAPKNSSKADARRKWKTVVRGTTPETIIKCLERRLPDLLIAEERFRPHASTWLGRCYWDEDVAVKADSFATPIPELPKPTRSEDLCPDCYGSKWVIPGDSDQAFPCATCAETP